MPNARLLFLVVGAAIATLVFGITTLIQCLSERRKRQARLRQRIDRMPGGVPKTVDRTCGNLSTHSTELSTLDARLANPLFTKRCQMLSGVLDLLARTTRVSSCAVVGGSGLLRTHPRGAEIDGHEAVFRVNHCPVSGFEALVGGRTTIRMTNAPRTRLWARELTHPRAAVPDQLRNVSHVLAWGTAELADVLQRTLPSRVALADPRFRRECVDRSLWSATEIQEHKTRNGVDRLEITFGFEAVAHALFSCERVSAYGFFLDSSNSSNKTPYHYFEDVSYDASPSVQDPWRPWTYKFHNFALEHQKLGQLADACWLRVN